MKALGLFNLENRLGGINIIVNNYAKYGYREPDSSQNCIVKS